MTYRTPILATLGLAMSFSTSTAIVVPEPAHAFDLKKATSKFKKNNRKFRNKLKRRLKSPAAKKIIQGAGVALIAGGIAKDSPAAAIIGVALVAAPELIKKDIAKSYKKDLNWSGCTRCTKKKPRAVVVPGRKVDKKQQAASISRVKEDVKDVQRALKQLGLYNKGIDGDFGPGSRAGVKEFQRSLGEKETGILTAEQRYRLFIQAEQKGYTRQAVLNKIDEERKQKVSTLPNAAALSAAVVTPAVLAPSLTPQSGETIEEYLLAKSQFEAFNQQYLQSGNQSLVTDASLRKDGKIALTVQKPNGEVSKTVTGFVNDIKLTPHKLSDQWIRIVFEDGSVSEPIVLNTRDDFPSTEAASSWMAQAYGKIDILAKLTEVEPKKPEVIVVSADPAEPIKPAAPELPEEKEEAINAAKGDTVEFETAAAPEPSDNAADKQPYKAGSDGKIVIADKAPEDKEVIVNEPVTVALAAPESESGPRINPEPKAKLETAAEPDTIAPSEEPEPKVETEAETETETQTAAAPQPESPVTTPAPIKVSLTTEETPANTLTGFDPQEGADVCQQNIYVSFSFPDGENPISHYNIVPPEGTIMIDNGDSTAYFTGACIQGNYGFSYVYVQEAAKQKDWKHFKREGSFQIASNNEQCSIDLNTPEKSAQLRCF